MEPRFVLKTATNNQYHFVLKAGNSEIILSSETYTTKQNAINGINSVITHSSNRDNFKPYRRTKNNIEYYYFVLEARNGEPIGTSEMYTQRAGRDNGIDSVQKNAPKSKIVDIT